MSSKYIVVVGGVYSGTGKGISAASIALLLKMRGVKVQYIKCDPYLNLNAGTMSPTQHGEVFLCDDGSETDLDLGHIERLAGITMTGSNIFTNGIIYKDILQQEENGNFLGETVQIVPHLTDNVQSRLLNIGKDHDIVIAEIGGTVGDFESGGFFEAVRQFKLARGDDLIVVMVSPIIYNETVQEFKTKPLQNSVRTLQSCGLTPDILLCRCDRSVPKDVLQKVSRLTGVSKEAVFEAIDVDSIYRVPIEFYERHVDDLIVDKFHLKRNGCRIHKYRELVEKNDNADLPTINIGVLGKYENVKEAYISLKEAIFHAAASNDVRVNINWVNVQSLEKEPDPESLLRGLDGIIVPGGFDKRGIDGKIYAIKFARENKIPFLGICLGLQCMVIEFARNVCGIIDADSLEFSKNTPNPVIHFVDGQQNVVCKSGTMRLGAYDCSLSKNSLAHEIYGKKFISERHRHRYEVNGDYRDVYANYGLKISGVHPQTGLIEIMEMDRDIHPYFIGTQSHPEFKSRLVDCAPLFKGLIAASIKVKANRDA